MKIFCRKCSKVFNAEIPEGTQEVSCPECSETVSVPESPLSPGAVIGDFLLEKSLSSGGMGVVYLARQLSLDRPVALKVLRDKFAANQEYIEGLFHEARAAAKLTHPNIVQAYAVGEENGVFYFAMEYIRGETFKQILKKQNILDTAEAVKVIREICSALQAAWNEQKLVHQDIKPDNIMLDSNGFAKLADLGLARSANTDAGPDENETEVMGTPQYISPEQLTGVPTDVRSDIYSLGATFYQFVTGQFPYPAESAEEMARKHVEGNLTPPIEINPELPKAINDVIIKMMARNIDQRYQAPSEVIADLDAYQDLKKISSIAVPKLKLNLNKKATGVPAPAKPGLAIKPAAKPGVSPAAKPAVPTAAKPAVPPAAKPAVPPAAKPAVPPAAPPAAPAAEPPAAKPAGDLPPEQPAPAEETKQPAAAAEEDIVLAPKKEKTEEKTEEKPAEETDKKNSSDKKKKKSEKESSGRGIGKIILLIVLIPLILLAAASGLFFAAHKGVLGKKGKAISGSVCTFLQNKKIVAQPGTKGEGTAAQNSTSPAKIAEKTPVMPVEKPKPVTRKEFIAAAEKLISDYRLAPKANAAAFLKGTDRFIKEFLPPRTGEEKEAFGNLYRIYDTVDDFTRAQPYRLEAVKKIEAQLKQRELEAAKAREAEKKQQQALRAVQKQFSTQTDIKQDKEKEQRIRTLMAAYALLYRNLAEAFVKSVHTLDPSHFTNAARSAESPFSIEKNSTQQEYDMEEEFINFRDVFLKKAFEQFKSFYADVRKITPSNSFSMGSRLEIEVIRIEPPKVIYKHSQRKGERELKLHHPRRRAEFYRHMLRKTKNKHIPFFFEFLEGRLLRPVTDKNVPSKEWTRHLKHLCPPIKAGWTPTAKKAPVRKAPARPVKRRK